MDGLYRYLVEKFELASAISTLQEIIDNKDEKAIKLAFYAISDERYEDFKVLCKDRGIPEVCCNSFWMIFKKYNSLDLLFDVMDGTQIPASQILNNEKVDLISLIKSTYPNYDVDQQIIKELLNLKFPKKTAVGAGEFFFSIFLEGCVKTEAGADLQINNINTEVKGQQGKFHGISYPNTFNLIKNLKRYNKEHGTKIKIGRNLGDVRGSFDEFKNDIAGFTAYLLGCDINGEFVKNAKTLFDEDYGYTREYIQFLKGGDIQSADDWLLSMEAFALKVYSQSENFEQVLLFNGSIPNYIPVSIVNANQSIAALFKHFKKINLTAVSGIDNKDVYFLLPKLTLKK